MRIRQQRGCSSQTPPPSGQKPSLMLTSSDLEAMAEELVAHHRLCHPLFPRREQREWSLLYLRGQLSEIKRKSIEPIVLTLAGPDLNTVGAVQQFIGEGVWADELSDYQRII